MQLIMKELVKQDKKLNTYRNACSKIGCEDAETMHTVNEISFCMLNCKYSGQFVPGKYGKYE